MLAQYARLLESHTLAQYARIAHNLLELHTLAQSSGIRGKFPGCVGHCLPPPQYEWTEIRIVAAPWASTLQLTAHKQSHNCIFAQLHICTIAYLHKWIFAQLHIFTSAYLQDGIGHSKCQFKQRNQSLKPKGEQVNIVSFRKSQVFEKIMFATFVKPFSFFCRVNSTAREPLP